MLQNLNISFACFARKTQDRLDEMVAATKWAMESAHSRRKSDNGSIESGVSRMGDRIVALETLKPISPLCFRRVPGSRGESAGLFAVEIQSMRFLCSGCQKDFRRISAVFTPSDHCAGRLCRSCLWNRQISTSAR
jgi:hypothetical protein